MGLGSGVDTNILNWGETHENLPIPASENIPAKQRMFKYGESAVQSIFPGFQALAAEGSLYTLQNPTIGTQVTYAVVASYSATQAAFALRNSWSASDQQKKNSYLAWVKLMFTGTPVVPASAVSAIISARVDDGSVSRVPTAGQRGPDLPLNVNSGSSQISRTQIYEFAAGVMTVPAGGSNERLVGRTMMRNTIPVVQDELICYFGTPDSGSSVIGTTAGRIVSTLPTVVAGPGGWILINIWFPSNATTAGQFEYELGIIER